MAPKGLKTKSKIRSLSNDKIEEFESIEDSMPQITEADHDVTI